MFVARLPSRPFLKRLTDSRIKKLPVYSRRGFNGHSCCRLLSANPRRLTEHSGPVVDGGISNFFHFKWHVKCVYFAGCFEKGLEIVQSPAVTASVIAALPTNSNKKLFITVFGIEGRSTPPPLQFHRLTE